MNKKRLGFTILETVLFLAISTLLLMAITWGITRRIADGRYNSTVDEFANIIRNVYSSALNVENARFENEGAREYCTIIGGADTENKGNLMPSEGDEEYQDYPGRTGCAIYGKLIIFGNSDGPLVNNAKGDDIIYSFNLVGDAVDQSTIKYGTFKNLAEKYSGYDDIPLIEQLKAVHLDYLALIPDDPESSSSFCEIKPASSLTKSYVPWGASVYSADEDGLLSSDDFVGMMMIVRSPISGDVSTLIYQSDPDHRTDLSRVAGATDKNSNVNTTIGCTGTSYGEARSELHSNNLLLSDYMEEFKSEENGFCIATREFLLSNLRRYVGVSKNGQNANAVFIDASEDNPCYAKK